MEREKFLKFNRTLGKHSRVFFLKSDHLTPFTVSVIFGIIIGQLLELGFFWTILAIAWPFGTWLIVAGEKPWKFRAPFERVPRWTRGRVCGVRSVRKNRAGRIVK